MSKHKRHKRQQNKATLQLAARKMGIFVLDMPTHIEFRAISNARWLGNYFRDSRTLVPYNASPRKGISPFIALGVVAGLSCASDDTTSASTRESPV